MVVNTFLFKIKTMTAFNMLNITPQLRL